MKAYFEIHNRLVNGKYKIVRPSQKVDGCMPKWWMSHHRNTLANVKLSKGIRFTSEKIATNSCRAFRELNCAWNVRRIAVSVAKSVADHSQIGFFSSLLRLLSRVMTWFMTISDLSLVMWTLAPNTSSSYITRRVPVPTTCNKIEYTPLSTKVIGIMSTQSSIRIYQGYIAIICYNFFYLQLCYSCCRFSASVGNPNNKTNFSNLVRNAIS